MYNLRPRVKKPVRLLPLFWYQLPDELLFHIGQIAAPGRPPGGPGVPTRWALNSAKLALGDNVPLLP